jgi:hypothetical protein
MAQFTPAGSGGAAAGGSVANPTVTTITLPVANTETSFALPAAAKKFLIQYRSSGILKLAFTVGTSGTTYISLYRYAFLSEDNLSRTSGLTLYMQATTAGAVVELLYWT